MRLFGKKVGLSRSHRREVMIHEAVDVSTIKENRIFVNSNERKRGYKCISNQ